MRVRKPSAAAAAPDPAADPSKLPFQLGELVLCRYSTYPYWPATIDQTHQKNQRGRYVKWQRRPSGASSPADRTLLFWCTFSNEDTGGWVRADRIVRFHPDLVTMVTVPEQHENYEDQAAAIDTARRDYEALNEGRDPLPAPDIPSDLREGHPKESDQDEDEDDDHDGPEDGDGAESDQPEKKPQQEPRRRKSTGSITPAKRTDAPATPRPRAKKEPRKSATKRKSAALAEPQRPKKKPKTVTPKRTSSDIKPLDDTRSRRERERRERERHDEMDVDADEENRRPNSRSPKPTRARGAADVDYRAKISELERSLEAANTTMAKLKRSLRKRENQIAGLTDGSSPVRVNTPPTPEVTDLPLPVKNKYRSVPMDGEKFTVVIAELRAQYDEFIEYVRTASANRLQLENETQTVQEQIRNLIDAVVESEKKAAESETKLAGMLRNVLLADIKVTDLRSHKAGNLLKAMTKKCKEMQLIYDFSNAIYETWMKQVMSHMDDEPPMKGKDDAFVDKKTKDSASAGNQGKDASDNGPSGSQKGKDEKDAGAEDDELNAKPTSKDEENAKVEPSSSKEKDGEKDGDGDVEMKGDDKGENAKASTEAEKGVEDVPGTKDGNEKAASSKIDSAKDKGSAQESTTGDKPKDEAERESDTPMDADKEAAPDAKADAKMPDAKAGSGEAAGGKNQATTSKQELEKNDADMPSDEQTDAPSADKSEGAKTETKDTDTPRSVTAPADSRVDGKKAAESADMSKSNKAASSKPEQKDASDIPVSADGRPETDKPEQKLPPSAGGKEATIS